jgi:hypothetical protein
MRSSRDHNSPRRISATTLLKTFVVAFLLVGLGNSQTTPDAPGVEPTNEATVDKWSFSFNLAGYIVPHDRSYASPAFSADRGRFHFGSRYNYEDKETGSLWVGYNFEIGEKLVFSATPMVGGVFGNTTGVAPGYLAAITWKRLELSTEGEYVFDTKDSTGNFFYSWMELTYSPTEWCRAGLVAQRTKAYHTSLDIQRGLLIGFSHKKVDFATYVFNAGWTDPTVVLSLGFNF